MREIIWEYKQKHVLDDGFDLIPVYSKPRKKRKNSSKPAEDNKSLLDL